MKSSPEPTEAPLRAERQAHNTIQRFGVLVCLDADLRHVHQVSANVGEVLGISVEDSLRSPATRVLGKRLTSRLRRVLQNPKRTRRALSATRGLGEARRNFYVTTYRCGDKVIVELEPLGPSSKQRWLSIVNEWLERIVSTQQPAQLLATLAESIRALTRYDRVLVHSFDAGWSSRVLAECGVEHMPSFRGYRFPPSHVAAETREAYHYNRVRMIADVRAQPIDLMAQPGQAAALDLRPGFLRASSQEKMEDLLAANVGASLSIAIFSDRGLWGRVVCHSEEPRTLLPAAREAAATLTQVASQRLFLLEAEANARYRDEVQQNRVLLSRGVQQRVAPQDLLHEHADHWLKLFNAGGLALVHRGVISCEGKTPGLGDIRNLANWLEGQVTAPTPWATSSLIRAGFHGGVAATACSGLLAVPLLIDMDARSWLLLFRPEYPELIHWAGLPSDVPMNAQGLGRQASFVVWREEVRCSGLPWHPTELVAAQDLGDDLTVIAAAHEIVRLHQNLQQEQEALAAANDHLKQVAQTDSLTGTANRYRMEGLIDDALAMAERYRRDFSLMLLDLDHFKAINDTYGHNVGDQVLKRLVEEARTCLRQTDQLGRWGGEEFIVLLRNTHATEACPLAERLLDHIRNADFQIGRQVTASMGVAQWRPGDTTKSLVARADKAMYKAKEAGRNQVRVAT